MSEQRRHAVSVIIPHLNQPEGLRRCLRSLAEQNYDLERVEIIVVDNGSTELPIQICREFPRVRLAHEPIPGPGPARNLGVRQSGADILAFVDADCFLDRNWLAAIEDAFSDPAVHVLGGDVRISRDDPERVTPLEAYESVFAYRQKEYIERQGFSGAGNLAVRRSAYATVGPFSGIDLAEDRHWGQRATASGLVLRYVPAMIVFHPARKSLDELRVKWDRHISHDFSERDHGWMGAATWALLAVAVAISPLFDVQRILRSERISGWRERKLATVVLAKTRWYRAARMLALLADREKTVASRAWNRT
jgi:glycosyltransferase involved in cell wall biosynthesis